MDFVYIYIIYLEDAWSIFDILHSTDIALKQWKTEGGKIIMFFFRRDWPVVGAQIHLVKELSNSLIII